MNWKSSAGEHDNRCKYSLFGASISLVFGFEMTDIKCI